MKNVKELIKLLCDDPEVIEVIAPDTKIYRGSILKIDIYGELDSLIKLLNGGYKNFNGEAWYNQVFKSDIEKTVISFCEGDVDIVVCNTAAAYKIEVDKTNKFYKEI